jgi:hypothetical protein
LEINNTLVLRLGEALKEAIVLNKLKVTKMIFKRPFVFFMMLLLYSNSLYLQADDKLSNLKAQSEVQIDFYDSKIFDLNLGDLLSEKESLIKVTSFSPFLTSDIPKRINNWLAATQFYGGTVKPKIDPDYLKKSKGRGPVLTAINLVISVIPTAYVAYNDIKEKNIYTPAENYNVTIFYKENEKTKTTGTVTKIVFSHK